MSHKLGIFYNESNEDYHSDNGFKSSSQLKLLLEDPFKFKAKYIDKRLPKEECDAFDIGNAFHTSLLEPDKFESQYINYSGHKRGEKWEAFKALHEGKTVLGDKQWLEYENLIKGVRDHADSKWLLEGKSEVGAYSKIEGIQLKVRFDKVNLDKQFGMDLKSTTGMLIGKKGTYKCLQTIASLDYDLSAALYLDTLNSLLEKIAKQTGADYKPVKDWYWIFASKDFTSCKILQASNTMLENGRKKYKLAIELLKKYEACCWEADDLKEKIEVVDPLTSDLVLDIQPESIETW